MKGAKWLWVVLALACGRIVADDLAYKERLLGALVQSTPRILARFDSETGRFGTGIWICRDQHPMYPLAVVYATAAEGNRYYRDPQLLEVIVKAGDPLLANMDAEGRWEFVKKDGSTWGRIWMPWTYSRWIRTFALVRHAMPAEARRRWSEALRRGYGAISRTQLGGVHNISAHHAMGLYIAGQVFGRDEWCRQAAEFLLRVANAQREGGYWSEGVGPVVLYNFVYIDALGTYYAVSGDRRVLPALERSARFHRHFTYPGGQNVETIDGRNPYDGTIAEGNVGFTFSPEGRAYLFRQWSRLGWEGLDADLIASLTLYGQEGPMAAGGADEDGVFVLREGGEARAATIRRRPWFICLSAYTAPISTSRWIQDRQNLVSIYHDKVGLIVGGGNTKCQPLWSNFTVGDPSLLSHAPGDTSPDFRPRGELYHVPRQATLVLDPEPGLDLVYGEQACQIRLRVVDERKLEYTLRASVGASLPVAAHLTLIPRMNQPLETAAGRSVLIRGEPVVLPADQLGPWIAHGGFRLHLPATFVQTGYRLDLPPGAALRWPVLPHNPYRKDGRAEPAEGRIALRLPFDADHDQSRVVIEVP
ncbi:MAG TPA: hypothetical protein EYH34_14595 [Planctomycetes bacterium]|nr:hypothetical protein [Planctomycetota bacterium]